MFKKSYYIAIPLFFIFLIFKLANVGLPAHWSWFWVISPLWIPIAVVMAIVLFVLSFVVVMLTVMFVVSLIWQAVAPKSYAAMVKRREEIRKKKELEDMIKKPPSPTHPNRSA